MDYKNTKTSFEVPVLTESFKHMECFLLLLIVLIMISISGCTKFPDPEKDDEGHASFAREVIPVLLGRRAHGVDEVEVVADISQLHGRTTAVEMLMRDTQFIDHWTHVIIDLLNVQRQSQGGLNAAQDSSCWSEPTRDTPTAEIAQWVRGHAPGDAGAPTPAWNMTDLIRSAIVLDDLSVIYRANLFPMSMRLAGASQRQVQVKDHFMKTYLNRNITCLRCHNPNYSASNKTDGSGDVVWRRLWTPTGHPEKALFGDYLDEVAANTRIQRVMRGDIRQPAASGFGTRPWGMMESCATDTNSRNGRNNGTVTHTGFKTAGGTNYADAGFGSLDGGVNPKVSVWELEAALRQGVADLQDGYQRFAPPPSADELVCGLVEVISGNCTGCHSGGSPSGGMNLASDPVAALVNVNTSSGSSVNTKRVVPGNTATSEISRRINAASAPPRMPPGGGGLSAADKSKIDDWIVAGAPSGDPSNCSSSDIPDVYPDEAFAFLTASNLVDGIWMSSMGYRLTIDHGYPRNRKQRDALWNLTEYTFLSNDWSLKSVLTKALDSNWMARRAPTISQADTAYVLPMVLDPWVEADPTEVPSPAAHEKANGQGEMINRYRVNTVLRQIGLALNWKQPRTFPSNTGYATAYGYPSPLDENLGQYMSPAVPGFSGVNFQSLLALENEIGLCNKSGRSLETDDYIDKLVSEVEAFNVANPEAQLTVGEVWSILKDRLIQDSTIERVLASALTSVSDAKTEEQALLALINQGLGTSLTLNSPATSLNSGQLESKLREACGVVVKTPEFLLTNVTPRGYSDNNMPDPPRINVCMDGEACGYQASCSKWRSTLGYMGKHTACEDRSVRKSVRFFFPFPLANEFLFERVNVRVAQLCPGGFCGLLPQKKMKLCLSNPKNCDPVPPIPIDTRNPLGGVIGHFPGDLHQAGVMVMQADGATVKQAKLVLHRQAGTRQWQSLRSGTQLATGDNLYVPLTASLNIKVGDKTIDVKGLKEAEIEGVKAHLISVTGSNAIQVFDRHYSKKGSLKLASLQKGLTSERFESRGVRTKDWQRIIAYGGKPESKADIDMVKINKNFDELHFPAESGMAPDGTDLPSNVPDVPDDPTDPTDPDDPDDTNDSGTDGGDDDVKINDDLAVYIAILVLILIGIAIFMKRRN